MRRSLASLVCLTLICLSARADQVDNPQYKAWASLKPGSSVTMSTTTSANGQTVKMETKRTLSAVADDKVTISVDSTMDMNGQKMTVPTQTQDVKKTIDTAASQAPTDITPDALAKATEESVTVPAGTFKAKAIDMNFSQQGANFKGKTWFSNDIPGGTIKAEITSDGPVKSETKMEITAIDKK
jgi:molybdenum cofactor biosynthesis enzyme MoaA